jgi:hypothetical protein
MPKEINFFHIARLCAFQTSETPFLKIQKLCFYVLKLITPNGFSVNKTL